MTDETTLCGKVIALCGSDWMYCNMRAGHKGKCAHISSPVALNHTRPMSFHGSQSERRAGGDTAQLSATGRSVPHASDNAPFPHPSRAGILHRIADAKCCGSQAHYDAQSSRDIVTTNYCLTCAVMGACTLERTETGRVIRDDTDEIMAWAFDVAEHSRSIAEDLAKCAAEHPELFLRRYELAHLRAKQYMLERAKEEIRGAYSELDETIHRHEEQTANTSLGASLRVVLDALGSGLALLEEL